MSTFSDNVRKIVTAIPYGKVMSYGQVAALAGNPRSSRVVGWVMHANDDYRKLPCYRVVFKDGSLPEGYVFGGAEVQRNLLAAEGVTFTPDGKVDLALHSAIS
ncbi:MAG: MGMT family protein [Oscillospiraceae bacterium]|jgi:methylated-DNA-protein-cysteine methyltransferase-like protein|nr:MGMT family protein [Oscillospiraceae bacterium]